MTLYTRLTTLVLSVVMIAPMAYAVLHQAAQIVA